MKSISAPFTIAVSILFLAFPFLYFYLRIWYRYSILTNELFTYLVIAVLGILFSLFITKQLNKNVREELKNGLLLLFAGLVIFYGIFIFLITVSNYNRMVSQSIDVQYFHEVAWQLSEFKVPYLYGWDKPIYAAWSQHFAPILFFISPIYWFIKTAGMLMVIQALIFISGTIPIYLTSKNYLRSRLIGLSLLFAYLAFGGTQFGIAYGFHEIMLFPTIFLWMYYFYIQKRIKLYLLFVLLSLFVKEEVSFIMIFWGIYLFLFKKDRLLGSVTMTLGIFWYILCFSIIFPKFNPGGFGYWGQYTQTNDTGVLGIIIYAVSNPLGFLKTLVTPSFKIDTFFQSFGSFGFLLFLFPPSFIIVIPSLLEKLLSSGIAAMNGTHYSAALTGVTLVATIESIYKIQRRKYFTNFIGNINVFIGIFLFYLALFFNMLYGYYAFSLIPNANRTGYRVGNVFVEPSDQNLLLLSRVIDAIPKQASVSAQYQIVPHIHKSFTLVDNIPHEPESADYVLVDTQLPPPVLTDTSIINKYLEKLDQNKNYQLVVNNLGVVLFKRVDSKF